MTNLMSNAAKYSRSNPSTRIQFGRRTSRQGREYFVKDNGIGFDGHQSILPAKPFQRHHVTSQHEGLGLGLTIVQRVINQHGGTLRAEGAAGQGATFFFTLGSQDALH
jgi:light-regulated signal transduction histidine kinase (bacteriophytochrome)